MDNQHRAIKGYRELSQDEIDLMNAVKNLSTHITPVLDKLAGHSDTDKRWVAIGKTDMQTALMALTRAIAKPDFL